MVDKVLQRIRHASRLSTFSVHYAVYPRFWVRFRRIDAKRVGRSRLGVQGEVEHISSWRKLFRIVVKSETASSGNLCVDTEHGCSSRAAITLKDV